MRRNQQSGHQPRDDSSLPAGDRRLLRVEQAADYVGLSRSAMIEAEKTVPGHPQSFRHPAHRCVVFDRLELDDYSERIKADHRGEPLPPRPVSGRQSFLQEQIAAWCSNQVMIPVEPGSVEAKTAAVREALRLKQDVTTDVMYGGKLLWRTEYRWQPDGTCQVTEVEDPKPKRPRKPPSWLVKADDKSET